MVRCLPLENRQKLRSSPRRPSPCAKTKWRLSRCAQNVRFPWLSYFEKNSSYVSGLSICIFVALWLCLFECVLQGPIRRGSTPASSVLLKSVRFFIIIYFQQKLNKTLSKLNSGQYPVQMTRKPMQERGLKGVKNPKTPLGEPATGPSRSLRLRRSFRKSLSIYPRSAPANKVERTMR